MSELSYEEPITVDEPDVSSLEPPAAAEPANDFDTVVASAVDQRLNAIVEEHQQSEAQEAAIAEWLGEEWDEGYESRLGELRAYLNFQTVLDERLAPLEQTQQRVSDIDVNEAARTSAESLFDGVERVVGAFDRDAAWQDANEITDAYIAQLQVQGMSNEEVTQKLVADGFAQAVLAATAQRQAQEARGPFDEQAVARNYSRDESGRFTRTGAPFAFATRPAPTTEKDAALQFIERRRAAVGR